MCWSLPAGTPAQTQMGELHDNRHKVLGLQTERSPQGLPHHWAACCGESWNYQQTVVTAELLHLYTVKWLVCNSNDILCKCDMKVDFRFCQVTWLQEFKPNIDSALCWNTVKHQHWNSNIYVWVRHWWRLCPVEGTCWWTWVRHTTGGSHPSLRSAWGRWVSGWRSMGPPSTTQPHGELRMIPSLPKCGGSSFLLGWYTRCDSACTVSKSAEDISEVPAQNHQQVHVQTTGEEHLRHFTGVALWWICDSEWTRGYSGTHSGKTRLLQNKRSQRFSCLWLHHVVCPPISWNLTHIKSEDRTGQSNQRLV